MGVVRKILIFLVLTAGIIAVGKLVPRLLPDRSSAPSAPNTGLSPDSLRDTTNALPAVEADTTGGRWHEKLFEPLERMYGLDSKSIKQKRGYWEAVFPKGKPIHEYALAIEEICRAKEITVEQGVELRPINRSVEYLLQSNGQRIKLRASLGNAFMAGSAKLAIVFTGLDSLTETQAAELESAAWDKSLVVNPYNPNPALKKLRFTRPRNELLVELPMEPSSYPYVDPGKHALFIHHSKEDVESILDEDLDSVKQAAGFVSRYGDRAIENQPLLEKFFQYTARKNLAFLDLTGSPRSLARQTAVAQGARSRSLTAYKDSVHIEEELARKAAMAQKTGDAILVLPYTATGFRNLQAALSAEAVRFNEMGLELVTLSSLAAKQDSIASAAESTKPSESEKSAPAPASSARPAASKSGAPKGAASSGKSGGAGTPGGKGKPSAGKSTSTPAAKSAKQAAKAPAKPAGKTPAKPASKEKSSGGKEKAKTGAQAGKKNTAR
jgi:polysaccharide deacetylase 2 family uncharacterized protein YibQ